MVGVVHGWTGLFASVSSPLLREHALHDAGASARGALSNAQLPVFRLLGGVVWIDRRLHFKVNNEVVDLLLQKILWNVPHFWRRRSQHIHRNTSEEDIRIREIQPEPGQWQGKVGIWCLHNFSGTHLKYIFSKRILNFSNFTMSFQFPPFFPDW